MFLTVVDSTREGRTARLRGAIDTIPQRQLVYELALAIDRVRSNNTRVNRANLDRLLDENPRSCWSRHVQHNIGARRAAWLLAYRDGRAPAAGSASPSGATRS